MHHDKSGETGALLDYALDEIEQKYGPEGQTPKSYHNALHTAQVMEAAEQIGYEVGLPPKRHRNLIIAAAFHDIVHDADDDNEGRSAQIAVEKMLEHPAVFTGRDRDDVAHAIEDTRVNSGGGFPRQNAHTRLGRLLADADLSNLGLETAHYWRFSARYFEELFPDSPDDGSEMQSFLYRSLGLLSMHEFYTPEAKRLFPYQQRNLCFTRVLLRRLELAS